MSIGSTEYLRLLSDHPEWHLRLGRRAPSGGLKRDKEQKMMKGELVGDQIVDMRYALPLAP